MWRYWVGAAAMALVGLAAAIGVQATRAPVPDAFAPPPPMPLAAPSTSEPRVAGTRAPAATERTREEKRFARYDKDKNGAIVADEYLAARRKAFAKLDLNGDGRLGFDEYAAKTATKFAAADRDRSGALTPAEFATTRVVRKVKPQTRCPEPATAAKPDEDADQG